MCRTEPHISYAALRFTISSFSLYTHAYRSNPGTYRSRGSKCKIVSVKQHESRVVLFAWSHGVRHAMRGHRTFRDYTSFTTLASTCKLESSSFRCSTRFPRCKKRKIQRRFEEVSVPLRVCLTIALFLHSTPLRRVYRGWGDNRFGAFCPDLIRPMFTTSFLNGFSFISLPVF